MTSTKRGVPENSSILIPRLFCREPARAIDFCVKAFGAVELGRRHGPDGEVVHALLAIGPEMLMVEGEWQTLPNRAPLPDGSSPVVVFLYVDDVDDVVYRAAELGARTLVPAQDQFWGDRTAWIMDPSGHVWTVATRIEETTAEERNERWSRVLASGEADGGGVAQGRDELSDFREHLERYRAVTLQVLEVVEDGDLTWRPSPEQYSLGQQLLHIAQTEDLYAAGLFHGDWDFDRARFPAEMPDRAGLRAFFEQVRSRTLDELAGISVADLGRVVPIPESPIEASLRSWLWFILEHELHHKGQIWLYLRQLGYTAPFYAMPLPLGTRPDHQARQDLGGF